MPFDYKGFKGALSAQTTYSTLKKGKASPTESALLSDRWKTAIGDVGVLIDLSRSESGSRTDALQVDPYYPRTDLQLGKTLWVPRSVEWRRTDFDRIRSGQYGALQWRPNSTITTALTYFRSNYKMTWHEHALVGQEAAPYDINVGDGVYGADGALISGVLTNPKHGGINFTADGRVADSESTTSDTAFNLMWHLAPQWTMRVDAQRVRASTWRFDSTVSTGLFLNKESLDLSGGMPVLNFDQGEIDRLAQQSSYYWASMMEHKDAGTAGSKALKLDMAYDFDDPVLRDLRFGVRSTNRDATTRNSNPSYHWAAITAPWQLGYNISKLANLADPRFQNDAAVEPFNNFFNGNVNVPGVVFAGEGLLRGYPNSYAKLGTYHDILCAEQKAAQGWGSCPAWAPASFGTDPAELNSQTEKNRAAYAQLRFGFDKLDYPIDGSLGLRYVRTNANADGYTVFTPNLPKFPTGSQISGVAIPVFNGFSKANTFEHDYHNWLPSLNLRMKAGETLQFRLALAQAIARPSFSQMQGYTSLSEKVISTTNTATKSVNVSNVVLAGTASGEPLLNPTKSNQADLTAEWYPSPGSSLTLTSFYKKLKDIVINQTTNYALNGVDGNSYNFQVTAPVNGARGTVKGLELAGQTYLDKLPWFRDLPSLLSGFGVQGSLTTVSSTRELYHPVFSAYCPAGGGSGADNLNYKLNGCDTDGRSFNGLPLVGISRNTVNLALLYDHGPLSARLAYNWRSRYMQAVQTTGTNGPDGTDTNPASPTLGARTVSYGLPIWSEGYGQLDGSLFYKFSENLSLGLEAQNLTNATYKQTMQQHIGDMGHTWYTTGPRYTAQMRYTF